MSVFCQYHDSPQRFELVISYSFLIERKRLHLHHAYLPHPVQQIEKFPEQDKTCSGNFRLRSEDHSTFRA